MGAEDQFKLKVQLRREELEFRKEQFALITHRSEEPFSTQI